MFVFQFACVVCFLIVFHLILIEVSSIQFTSYPWTVPACLRPCHRFPQGVHGRIEILCSRYATILLGDEALHGRRLAWKYHRWWMFPLESSSMQPPKAYYDRLWHCCKIAYCIHSLLENPGRVKRIPCATAYDRCSKWWKWIETIGRNTQLDDRKFGPRRMWLSQSANNHKPIGSRSMEWDEKNFDVLLHLISRLLPPPSPQRRNMKNI